MRNSLKAGIPVVAVHKGLFPPSDERKFPRLTEYAKVDDVGKAAKDWPQLSFPHLSRRIPLHRRRQSGARGQAVRRDGSHGLGERSRRNTGRNLASATSMPMSARASPRSASAIRARAAAMMAMLVKGLGSRSCALGHKLVVVRLPAMADRSVPPPRDTRGYAAPPRLCGAGHRRWRNEARHLGENGPGSTASSATPMPAGGATASQGCVPPISRADGDPATLPMAMCGGPEPTAPH